jgi:hypothetical protein
MTKENEKEKTEKPDLNLEVLEIDGRKYELYIGFAFVREIDKLAPVKIEAMAYGSGVYMLVDGLAARSPIALLHVIQAGTCTEKQKPSLKGIEKLIDDWFEAGVLEDVYKGFLDLLENRSMTAPVVRMIKKVAMTN